MKIRLLTSMAGDDYAYSFGDIVDTNEVADRNAKAAIKIATAKLIEKGVEPSEAAAQAKLEFERTKPLSADEIGKGWIDAGIAEAPKSEQVLKADIEHAERIATDAMAQAEAAVAERTEIAVERDTLKAQVDALSEAAGDGADAAKELGAVKAERDNLKKQLGERETQLATARADIRAEFEAKQPAGDTVDTVTLSDQLATSREALNAALAPPAQ